MDYSARSIHARIAVAPVPGNVGPFFRIETLGTVREPSIEPVCDAHALRKRRIRKSWVLVRSRVDTIARHPELLEAWRPIAAGPG